MQVTLHRLIMLSLCICEVSNSDKGWSAYWTYRSGHWLPGSPCIPQYLRVTGSSCLGGISRPLPWTLQPGCWVAPSLYNPTIWLSLLFAPLDLLDVAPGPSLSPLPPPSSLGTAQSGHVHPRLSQMSLTLAILSHISIVQNPPGTTQHRNGG